LTTKLTTERLDALGRPWTARRVLHYRRVQVRFLSPLPVGPEFMGMAGPSTQSNARALTPIRHHQQQHRTSTSEGTRFHDLWHTCATLLLSHGADAMTVSDLLGYSTNAITRTI
jgi:hypothetical protein